jgi:pyruvate,water dikinase
LTTFTKHFSEINIKDISSVGGKNASLGEMYASLSTKGIMVPEGFAVTADGYKLFLDENKLTPILSRLLEEINTKTFDNLSTIALQIRAKIMESTIPKSLEKEIIEAYQLLVKNSGETKTYAVRSSATAEDLPNASFAGQQETYLNVKGEINLIKACHRCYASLFTDRAIKYRFDNGFDHMKVALSIGVQTMIRSDLASSGVMFTIDPDTGFDKVVLISGAWGLGENVVPNYPQILHVLCCDF